MSQLVVRRLLETALIAISGGLSSSQTKWENRPFTPTPNVAYQRVDLLPAEPENPTVGDGFYRERGSMQVSLFFPAKGGSKDAQTQAELIRSAFPRGTKFTEGSVTVHVDSQPTILPAYEDGDRYVVPVRVRYYANVFA